MTLESKPAPTTLALVMSGALGSASLGAAVVLGRRRQAAHPAAAPSPDQATAVPPLPATPGPAEAAHAFALRLIGTDSTAMDAWRHLPPGPGRRASPPVNANLGLVSVRGPVRERNEDFAWHVRQGERTYLIVSDGMGGHAHGNLASRVAVYAARQYIAEHPDQAIRTVIATAFREAQAILAPVAGIAGPDAMAMGCTLIILGIQADRYVCGWIGDGGAHVRRLGGAVEPLLRPHKGEAANLLARYLGTDTAEVPDMIEAARRPGDLVVLGSDGVFDRFDDIPALLDYLDGLRARGGVQHAVDELICNASQARDENGAWLADDNLTLGAFYTPVGTP